MTNSQRLATVRACFLAWLAAEQKGVATPGDSERVIVRESILIRNEFYCGRRFHTAGYHAVWFIEEDELKIYRHSGELACVLSSEQIDRSIHNAAAEHHSRQAIEHPNVIQMPPLPDHTAPDHHEDADGDTRRAA